MFSFHARGHTSISLLPSQPVSYHTLQSTGGGGRVRRGAEGCSHKGERFGNYPSRVEEKWWDLLMEKEGVR